MSGKRHWGWLVSCPKGSSLKNCISPGFWYSAKGMSLLLHPSHFDKLQSWPLPQSMAMISPLIQTQVLNPLEAVSDSSDILHAPPAILIGNWAWFVSATQKLRAADKHIISSHRQRKKRFGVQLCFIWFTYCMCFALLLHPLCLLDTIYQLFIYHSYLFLPKSEWHVDHW